MKLGRGLLFVAKLAMAAAMIWWIAGSGLLRFDKVGAASPRPMALGGGLRVTLLSVVSVLSLLGRARFGITALDQAVTPLQIARLVVALPGDFFFLVGKARGHVAV